MNIKENIRKIFEIRNLPFFIIILAVLALCLLIFVKLKSFPAQDENYVVNVQKSGGNVANSGSEGQELLFDSFADSTSIVLVIKKINQNSIVGEFVKPTSGSAGISGSDGKKEEKIILIGDETEIVLKSSIPKKVDKKGMPFSEERKIGLGELQINDEILVEAEENIRDKKEFEAKRIVKSTYDF